MSVSWLMAAQLGDARAVVNAALRARHRGLPGGGGVYHPAMHRRPVA
jgi:hypothetical protein